MCPGQNNADGFCLFLPTLRRSQAVSMRCCIASVRLDTPSGNLTSSRFRCVRSASAFAETYFFPLESFLSIWHDIPLSLPLPRCRWQTACCVLLISVRFMVIVTVVKSRPVAGGIYLKSEGQPFFHGTASCPIPFRHSTLPASTSSSPKVSMKVCNMGLRSIILARIICGVSSISRKSAMSSP